MAFLHKPNEIPLPTQQQEQLCKDVQQLEALAQVDNHRYLVVISGDEVWANETLAQVLSELLPCSTLLVSDSPLNALHCELNYVQVKAKQVQGYLGAEVQRLVWDGFSGLNPDALGAASGLLKGGGLLFLAVPDLTTLSPTTDPDYLRMCRDPSELVNFGSRFLQRMVKLIQTDPQIYLIKQDQDRQENQLVLRKKFTTLTQENDDLPQTNTHLLTDKDLCISGQLSTDQRIMITQIKTVSSGHRKRPLVVMADRGRGKTSALGIAAANITTEQALNVVITAPTKRACEAAFKHYQLETQARKVCNTSTFEFYAPDALLESRPLCHILFVDEAASIPAPMLKQILEIYPRVVFSSTTHGYEGTGQGFNIRFRHTLDTVCPQWKSLTLNQAVRWAEADPLERWVFDFLLLDAQMPQLSASSLLRNTAPAVSWVSQDMLANDTLLLKQVVSLLVSAHYQTRPSDIRMILDDPSLTIGLIQKDVSVAAVILLLREGGVTDNTLSKAIINGTRRPKGHLVPQALTSSTANPDFLSYQSYRVMRIAVHPSLNRQGLGSQLIQATVKLAQNNKIDYLSASFGFTPPLNDFWRTNKFKLLRVGYHKDAASGAQSAIVVRAINTELTEKLINRAKEQFQQHFIFGLNTVYQTLEIETTINILQSISEPVKTLSNTEIDIIHAFAHYHRSFEDCAHILFMFILNCFALNVLHTLSMKEQHLVCLRVLKGENISYCVKRLSLSGKKELDTTLKKAVSTLLNATKPYKGSH